MYEHSADWSQIVSCEQCGRANPSDIYACLNCGHQIGASRETDPEEIRPYARCNTALPFIAQRTTGEVDRALECIRQEHIFSWAADTERPSELTAEMIADAENTIRLRLPSSLLAILKMQNGGDVPTASIAGYPRPARVVPRLTYRERFANRPSSRQSRRSDTVGNARLESSE